MFDAPGREIGRCHLHHLGYLTIGRGEEGIGDDDEESTSPPSVVVVVTPLTEIDQVVGPNDETSLLGQLPDRRVFIGFIDAGHTPERDIPQRRVDILPVGPLMGHHLP